MSDVDLARTFAAIQARMRRAEAQAGRPAHSARLLAVSKGQPVEKISALYNLGQRHFAENYIQEWARKRPALPADICWHLVGRVQTNKVKLLRDGVFLLHSVDRRELLEALLQRAQSRPWSVLLQVDLLAEANKAGFSEKEAAEILRNWSAEKQAHVAIQGLMTFPSANAPMVMSGCYERLCQLQQAWSRSGGLALTELSMGTSGDFELAISAGATWVRVGEALFGARQKLERSGTGETML